MNTPKPTCSSCSHLRERTFRDKVHEAGHRDDTFWCGKLDMATRPELLRCGGDDYQYAPPATAPATQDNATPRPWTLSERIGNNQRIIPGDGNEGFTIANCSGFNTPEAQANAALIVRAVNICDLPDVELDGIAAQGGLKAVMNRMTSEIAALNAVAQEAERIFKLWDASKYGTVHPTEFHQLGKCIATLAATRKQNGGQS